MCMFAKPSHDLSHSVPAQATCAALGQQHLGQGVHRALLPDGGGRPCASLAPRARDIS